MAKRVVLKVFAASCYFKFTSLQVRKILYENFFNLLNFSHLFSFLIYSNFKIFICHVGIVFHMSCIHAITCETTHEHGKTTFI